MSVSTQTLKENKTRIPVSSKATPMAVGLQDLIDGLNHDLAGEYQAIPMYAVFSEADRSLP